MNSVSVAQQPRVEGPRRVPWSLILKLAITIGVTVYVISRAGLGEALDTLRSAQWGFVGMAAMFAVVAMVMNVARWRMMLEGQGSHAPLPTLVRLYLVGMFFNNILPSRFGADVVRAYGAANVAAGKTRSAASVVMDRLVGAISVLILGLAALVLRPSVMPSPLGQSLLLLFLLLCVVLGLLMYQSRATSGLRERFLRMTDFKIFGIAVSGKLDTAITAMRSYAGAHGLIARALAISLLANGLSIFNLYLYGTSVGAGVSLGDVAAVAPVILAVGLLPISINGLGTVELAFVVLFGAMGVPEPIALAIAILRRLVLLAMSLVGGALYTARRFA